MTNMQPDEHYNDFQWVDYLKSRILWPQATKMRAHLDVCADCRTRLNLCRTMHGLLSDQAASDPPGEWVREGISLFDASVFGQNPEYVFAMLTADSLIGNDPELRSIAVQERQLSFETAAYSVSVLVETSHSVLKGIVGQLSRKNADLAGAELKGAPSELCINGKVYETEMTEFGEFLFRVNEDLDGNPIELRFRMKEEPCLALLIPV